MPIFGQVWLWSSLAFLLGAVLCWLLVARPARSRVGELEAQLTTRARRPEPIGHRDDADFTRAGASGLGDDGGYRLQATPPPPLPPERGRLAPYADPEPNRDFAPLPPEREPEPFSFGNGLAAPPELDTELADQPKAAATQYLDVSSGSLSAPPEVPAMSPPPSDRGWFDDELEGDAANQAPEEQAAVPRNRHQLIEDEPYDARLVDDEEETSISSALATDEDTPRSAIEDDDGGTVFTQRTHPIPGELIRQIDEAGKEERARSATASDERGYSDNLVDDLAEDPAESVADRRERTVEAEAVAPPAGFAGSEVGAPARFAGSESGDPASFADSESVVPPAGFTRSDSVYPPNEFTEPEASSPSFPALDAPSAFTAPDGSSPGFPPASRAGFTEPSSGGFPESSSGGFPEPSSGGFTEPEPAFTEPEAAAFTEPPTFTESPTFTEPEPAFTEPEPEPAAAVFTEPEETPQEQTEVVAAVTEEAPAVGQKSASNLPKRVPQQNRITQGVSVRVEPTPSALPKRVPSKPRHQVPFGVMPSSDNSPEPVATATADEVPDPPRSLFEPIVPAEDEGTSTPPPPHRLRQGSGGGRGPFGPGSAMPLPGGASPSPEFTIKASVAALRYCTPDSPQFGRTVAEVWFRTAADAERVGFRPVG
jgi:hypothetical protein